MPKLKYRVLANNKKVFTSFTYSLEDAKFLLSEVLNHSVTNKEFSSLTTLLNDFILCTDNKLYKAVLMSLDNNGFYENKNTWVIDRAILINPKKLEKIISATIQSFEYYYNVKLKTKTEISKEFYSSNKWRSLRYAKLEESKGKCVCCGRSAKDNIILHVDHIKPRSLFPELALDITNLQVLCDDCNIGKRNKYQTNWN